MATTPALVNLTTQQQAQINTYIANKQYADGYRYVKTIVDENIQTNQNPTTLSNLRILSNWLGNAASINANDRSAKSEFVRGYTIAYGVLSGVPVTEAKFQQVSDSLANSVLSGISKVGIQDAATIINQDVSSAVSTTPNGFGFKDISGWAGTLGDALPQSIGGLGQDFAQVGCKNSVANCIASQQISQGLGSRAQ